MTNRSYGLVVRIHGPDDIGAKARVEEALANFFLLRLRVPHGIEETFFLVAQDHDGGNTYNRLNAGLAGQGLTTHHHLFPVAGHPNREVLNSGALMLMRCGVTHMIVASVRALPHLSKSLLERIDLWFDKGARVVGVAAGDLSEMIHEGCVQNTLAVWEIEALHRAGWFASEVAEEIAPLVGLVRKHGKCIAVVEGGEGHRDIRDSPAARAHTPHQRALKEAQQAKELERVRGEFGMLALAVMQPE